MGLRFLAVLGGFKAIAAISAGLTAGVRSPLGTDFLGEQVRPDHMLPSSLSLHRPLGAAGPALGLFVLYVPASAPAVWQLAGPTSYIGT